MKKVITISIVIVVAALLIMVGIIVIPSVMGNSKQVNNTIPHDQYLSLPDMVQASDVIVMGTVNKVEKSKKLGIELSDGLNEEYNISDIVIFKSIKGDYKEGDVIQVKELTTDGLAIKAGFLVAGEVYVLFLEDFPDIEGMPLSFKNPQLCKVRCVGNDLNYMEYKVADDTTEAFTIRGITVRELMERMKTGL